MTRVFPLEEWAPSSQESQSYSEYDKPTQDSDEYEAKDSLSHFQFRNRLRSLPLGKDPNYANHFRNMSMGDDKEYVHEEEKRERGLVGLFRRASISLKSKKQRRHSHATEERPATASPWRKLKQATSFNRLSRLGLPDADGLDSSETLSPIPGIGAAPPIIPRGSGGDAARRTAAAQNEYFGRHRQLLVPQNPLGDRESGIGIPVTMSEPMSYADALRGVVVGVDFMHILPVELCDQILAHLDHRDLSNTARASWDWYRASLSSHVWREAFLREKSKTYATSRPVSPGTGLGLPSVHPDHDWKDLYRIRQQLEHNWRDGTAGAVYLNGHLDSIYCVQFDETKIITGSRDKTIRVWDLRTYTCSLVIGPPGVVQNPAIMTGDDGRPQHYAIMPDQRRRSEAVPKCVSFDIHHDQSILCLQYDKYILVTGSSDGTCIVYDIHNGYRPIMRLAQHTAAVLDLAFDHRYIVTCSKDVSICVWDRQTGEMLKQLRGHSGPVNAVQMRGNTIVSCSGDFRVKLWNIDTGKNFREFLGHTKGLACSQFSDDSKYIASAGNDKVIRIWDANTGECLRKINAHDGLVRSLHIDSVSGRLLSGSYDQDIKVFDMETGRLLLDFPKWHQSWVLGAKSDYRRIISTGQDPKILIMDFGMKIEGIEKLESSARNV